MSEVTEDHASIVKQIVEELKVRMAEEMKREEEEMIIMLVAVNA